MKHLFIGSTIVLAFAAPAEASEFDFRGATIVGTAYFQNAPDIDVDWTTASLGASFELGLGGGFFAQKDATFQGYDMPWANYKLGSFGGHLGYEVGDGINVGAFGVGEFWDDGTGEMIVGGEVAGRMDNFFYEGYGAYVFDPLEGTGFEQYHVEATGGYAFGNGFGIELGVHYGSGDLRFTERMWQGLASVSYEVAPDISVEAGYVYSDSGTDIWDSQAFKVALKKDFGGGTTFSQRNYLSLHNGY